MSNSFKNFGDKIDQNVYLILNIFFSISLPGLIHFFQFYHSKYNGFSFIVWVYFILILITIVIFIYSVCKLNEYKELNATLTKQRDDYKDKHHDIILEKGNIRSTMEDNAKELINQYIKTLAISKFRFGDFTSGSDRISLFFHDNDYPVVGRLFLIGRFSFDDGFSRTGRGRYPSDIGAIGRAWNSNDGWLYESSFSNPETELARYKKEQAKFDVSEEIIDQLTMKSRFYCSWRIDDKHGEKLAVMVLESTEPNRFEEQNIKNILNEGERLFLSEMLYVLKDYMVAPSVAEEKGF